MESIRLKLGFNDCLSVNAIGKKGGLALLWKGDWKVNIINFSQWHISVWVGVKGSSLKWVFMGFYGEPKTNKHYMSWNLLKTLKPTDNTPWVVMGDFNEIFHHEKWVGKERSENLMTNFRDSLAYCGLNDLCMRGSQFTWSNKHEGGREGWVLETLKHLTQPYLQNKYGDS